MRGTCNTTQGKYWQAAEVYGCPVALPKPSHILPLWLVAMRPFVTLIAIVVSGSAQAQFPYRYGPLPRRVQLVRTRIAIWTVISILDGDRHLPVTDASDHRQRRKNALNDFWRRRRL